MNSICSKPYSYVLYSYKGEMQEKIDEFNALSDVTGSYWDQTLDGLLSKIKKSIKDHYLVAQDYRCAYCLQRIEVLHNAAWDAEHIVPKDSHPRFMFEPRNLCISCKDCNNSKRNKPVLINNSRKNYPDKSEDYIFCHPHFDDYAEHIKILRSAGFYLPKTDKGRKLVEICGLLRFLYKFSNYECVDQDIKIRMSELNDALMSSDDPFTQNFILDAISDVVTEGKRISKELGMKKLLGVQVASVSDS